MLKFYKCAKIGEKPIEAGRVVLIRNSPNLHANKGMFIRFLRAGNVALVLSFFMCCTTPKTVVKTSSAAVAQEQPAARVDEDIFFARLFKNQGGIIDSILQHRNDWKVQIIYTRVNRSRNGIPALRHYYFNKNDSGYFYPASTVKLPVAMLALEKLQALQIAGLHRNSSMITEAGYGAQTAVYNDPTACDGRPTMAQYIKKILLVSDNDAFNRLYEFLGPQYINESLHQKGYTEAEIRHRLDIFLPEDENRHTNPVHFYDAQTKLLYSKQETYFSGAYAARQDSMGMGFMRNGALVNGPMDFSKKNRISLQSLHNILLSLVFPQAMRRVQRFNLSEDDRSFLLKYMSSYPSESLYPAYDSSYHDAYGKFILFGARDAALPANIRIFNKPGDAYGQMTDVAYVVDYAKKVEFFVSATIYCNRDGILNDDRYDYTTIGLPFMQKLGELLYQHELNRKRQMLPDLSPLLFTYDKN